MSRSCTRLEPCLVSLLLLLHAVFAYHALIQHNPTVDEPGHLLSGLLAWKRGDVTYYYVNPPLVKMMQTTPLAPVDWELPRQLPPALPAFQDWLATHDDFLAANHQRFVPWVRAARVVNVLLSLACGWLVCRWSRELFGVTAGLVALSLWALSPNVLAWAGICTADLGAAFFALAAMYGLRVYLRRPVMSMALWAGLLLGLAQLAKFSLLVLYPVTLLLWFAAWWSVRRSNEPGSRPKWHHLVILLLVSLLVINLGYGCQGTGRPLGGFLFKCHALSGSKEGWNNRFQGTWLQGVPVPLPEAYVAGLDEQKSHADRGFPAYLRGEWRHGGWWYYYLYALVVKLPLGTLLLTGLALVLALSSPRYRAFALEEGLLWLPAAALLVLFSSQTGINSYLRYVLPMFPFLFIGIARVGILLVEAWQAWGKSSALPTGKAVDQKPLCPTRRVRLQDSASLLGAVVVLGALSWNTVSVLRIHPHHLSYFNELVGGPDHGWKHLIDSNIDWGQDLLFLKQWVESHPEASPLHLAYAGAMDPHYLGLNYRLAPYGPDPETGQRFAGPPPDNLGPRPGWYAVSVNFVCGMRFYSHDENGRRILVPGGVYRYFQHFQPIAKAGYSIFIYHITPEQANRVREEFGLPLLPTRDSQPPAGEKGVRFQETDLLRMLWMSITAPEPTMDSKTSDTLPQGMNQDDP